MKREERDGTPNMQKQINNSQQNKVISQLSKKKILLENSIQRKIH